MAVYSFEDLEVWKKSSRLSVNIYKVFSDSKEYWLRDQILRSVLSIPSNIAEGSERNSNKEFIRFINIAKGSASELRTQLYIAKETEQITSEQLKGFIEEIKHISAMLYKLIKSLDKKEEENGKL